MKKNKWLPFYLVSIFIFPVIVSLLVFALHGQLHLSTSNHGTLINPPLALQSFTDEKKWKIVFVPAHCHAEQIEKIMFQLHQLHEALGQDQQRVTLILLMNDTCQLSTLHDFRSWRLTPELLAKFAPITPRETHFTNKIYLVDPLNNVFMYYPVATQPMNIYNDLKRVLSVSQIG